MNHPRRHNRRGISTLWVILTLPVFLALLVFVVDVANLWLARVELENGLEAAALAAVAEWGKSSDLTVPVPSIATTDSARAVGVAYARANTLRGLPIGIQANLAAPTTGNPNANASCDVLAGGHLVFGAIAAGSSLTFNAGQPPDATKDFAVRAQATVPVSSLASRLLGVGTNTITARATACYNAVEGRTRLVRVDRFVCPGP
jgi:Flp pilus assembly protein TadG